MWFYFHIWEREGLVKRVTASLSINFAIQKTITKISGSVGIEGQELTERNVWAESYRKAFKYTDCPSTKSSKVGNSFI